MILIRPEQPTDYTAVNHINQVAFGRADEAQLVAALHRQAPSAISLVAWWENEAVGHILFTPVSLEPPLPGVAAAGLAPLAVLPSRQRQGIGGQLIEAGLSACRAQGYSTVIVLGHPEYYPRFGFAPAANKGVYCEFTVPPEAFMLCELTPKLFASSRVVARYHPAFASVT
ncbi:MAG: N-acetyltransferase [Candidatus Competibacteraceae bacterium]|nr:N-acetyltransferase [Candidatus Competibacteraceae bacterium]